jgi:hypothetical protein
MHLIQLLHTHGFMMPTCMRASRDYAGAERLYQRILKVDGSNAAALTDYATMISATDSDRAAALFEKSVCTSDHAHMPPCVIIQTTCMHTCMHVYVRMCMYVYVCINVCIHACMHACIYIYIYIYIHIYAFMYAFMYVCMHACICVCVCVCIYMHVCMCM